MWHSGSDSIQTIRRQFANNLLANYLCHKNSLLCPRDITAADRLLKDDNDNPSIGLLVCKSKNETVVKWAFEGIDRPQGIATYELDEVLKKNTGRETAKY
ncbi:PDDEXK nuclease domain-containing protein [Phocaeicola sartorii]|uniref:PDDEXK nuclease domain-containing protein n=1 Tax=Phocaeicola sartorii TaxID=671267 RepID=UPI0026F13C97|nr:PDDEXK nuclease domain-containing protein [Phocaeicola sartorii]